MGKVESNEVLGGRMKNGKRMKAWVGGGAWTHQVSSFK